MISRFASIESFPSSGYGEKGYRLKLELCRRTIAFNMKIFHSEDTKVAFDMTPLMESMIPLQNFDPYLDLDIENILSACNEKTETEGKSNASINLFDTVTTYILSSITKMYVKNPRKHFDPWIEVNLEMIGVALNEGHLWRWTEGSSDLTLIEVPMLLQLHTDESFADLQYLFDAIGDDQPFFSIVLNSTSKRFEVSLKTSTKLSPLAKAIEFPKPKVDTLLLSYLTMMRTQFVQAWRSRKQYIEELRRLCCVTEFQPLDFSFASLLIRLKYNKVCTIFLATVRISGPFPKNPPTLTIYDLLSSSILLFESADFSWDPNDNINTLAANTVLFICKMMNERIFSIKAI